ncbi:MAG: S-adenosylmethionine decarboxylase [Desulfosarcina sp.]|nr:S-adenosylmethionine decarboxylase [Desulfobacterales bacterium]
MKPEIFEFSAWLDSSDSKALQEIFDALLKKSGFTILNFIDHTFTPHGYTAVWLLSDSHFAIHTFPEKKQAYIQLSSCNKKKYAIFMNMLKKSLIVKSLRQKGVNVGIVSNA